MFDAARTVALCEVGLSGRPFVSSWGYVSFCLRQVSSTLHASMDAEEGTWEKYVARIRKDGHKPGCFATGMKPCPYPWEHCAGK